jgi:hypothetical protein
MPNRNRPFDTWSSEATSERRWSVVAGNLDRFDEASRSKRSCFRPDRAAR